MFFSFDGVDGAGKSTQIRLLGAWLRGQGREVVVCRDPGGTPLGEKLRSLLLDLHDVPIHRRSEMLLYMASRAQLVEEVIRPALEADKCVISDRYLLANVVYQAHGDGASSLSPDDVWQVGAVTVGGLMPDLVFLLDMPAEQAAARIQRSPDRMEARGLDYLERVRQGFLTEARRFPQKIAVINADQPIEGIHAEIIAAAQRILPGPSPQP
ncbi:MAG: dTMP kinase [Pirellulaceae bacterium]|nr:dTMP kinase [Pirellulaceae bacterium]